MVTSLKRAYGALVAEFGFSEFKAKDAAIITGVSAPNVLLHRLCERGYVERVSRGLFRAIHPLVLALEWAGYEWRSKIPQREYLPILEFVVARTIEGFGGKLRSLLLFGSVATGRAEPESDIDILIVAEGIPPSYSDRLRLFRELTKGIEAIRAELWEKRGIYPLIEAILLTPEEASVSHPFYLDMIDEAIVIFDRGGFMQRKLEELQDRLRKLGARRIRLPSGRWYWELKPEVAKGEVVEL